MWIHGQRTICRMLLKHCMICNRRLTVSLVKRMCQNIEMQNNKPCKIYISSQYLIIQMTFLQIASVTFKINFSDLVSSSFFFLSATSLLRNIIRQQNNSKIEMTETPQNNPRVPPMADSFKKKYNMIEPKIYNYRIPCQRRCVLHLL